MIRIAQQGRSSDSIAESLDEFVAGYGVHWVEVDGVRWTAEQGLTEVDLRIAHDEFNGAVVTLHTFGPVEIVYLGVDGEPLGPGRRSPSTIPSHFDHTTITTP